MFAQHASLINMFSGNCRNEENQTKYPEHCTIEEKLYQFHINSNGEHDLLTRNLIDSPSILV